MRRPRGRRAHVGRHAGWSRVVLRALLVVRAAALRLDVPGHPTGRAVVVRLGAGVRRARDPLRVRARGSARGVRALGPHAFGLVRLHVLGCELVSPLTDRRGQAARAAALLRSAADRVEAAAPGEGPEDESARYRGAAVLAHSAGLELAIVAGFVEGARER